MKLQIFSYFILFFIFSCQKNSTENTTDWVNVTPRISYKIEKSFLDLKSGQHSYKILEEKLPFKKVVLLNASLVGYFSTLEKEENIIGISSPEYIYSDKVLNLIQQNKIQKVGNEQKYDVEKLIALQPDAVFTNYIANFENTYEVLKKNGIEVIFIDEYLEEKPLQKTAILKIFGKLLGEEQKAKEKYTAIEKSYYSYQDQAAKTSEKPMVIANEMYGSQWYLPGGNSFVAQYIKDANADYILNGNTDSKAVPLSFEEVFVKSKNAKIWINAGNHQSKNELLEIQPNYTQMNVFQNGKIYAVTAKEKAKSNDFFESGVIRSDLVLKDYIKIFHPALFPDYELTFMKELK